MFGANAFGEAYFGQAFAGTVSSGTTNPLTLTPTAVVALATDSESVGKVLSSAAVTAGSALKQAGKVLTRNAIRPFNGTAGNTDSAALDLSAQNKITVSFGMAFNVGTDAMNLEHTANSDSNRGFQIYTNTSTTRWRLMNGTSNADYRGVTTPTQTAGTMHYYVTIMNAAASSVSVYVDGITGNTTVTNSGIYATSSNLLNSTLFMMSRNGSSFLTTGSLVNLGVWDASTTLTAAQITSLAAGVRPADVESVGLLLERYVLSDAAATVTRQVGKLLSPLVTPLATFLRAISKGLTASSTATVSSTEQTGKGLSAGAVPIASRTSEVGKLLSAGASGLATLLTGTFKTLVLSASAAASARLSWTFPITLRPLVCDVLTATAKACDTLGLTGIADSILSLAARADGTLSLSAEADGTATATPTPDN